MTTCSPGSTARRCAGRGRGTGRRRGDHDHRHRSASRSWSKAAAGPSAGWPRAPACSPRSWPPCSCVLTTDARSPRPRPTGRCARRPGSPSTGSTPTAACPPTTPSCCWPAAPPGSRRPEAELTEALTAACPDLALQLLADAEGADQEIAITVLSAASEDDAVEVGPLGGPEQPGQDRALRQGPELGPDPRRVGTTSAAFDPADLDVAINGVWVCRAGERRRGPLQAGRPVPAGGVGDHRPQGRPATAPRSGPTTCPTRTSTRTRRTRPEAPDDHQRVHRRRARRGQEPRRVEGGDPEGRHPDRGAAVAGALPRHDDRGQVRRQRDDRRRPAARLRRATWSSCATSGSARSWCTAAARRSPRCWTGSASQRVPGRAAGHHAGGDGRRPDGARRPGRPASWSA